MKKFAKIAMLAAACAACGALALGGCDGETANAMTDEDAVKLNAAFVQAQAYDGSYTIDEEYSSSVYYLGSTQYVRGDASVTYDGASGAMGYVANIESDGDSVTMGYYTVPQSDGTVMQYVDMLGLKFGASYSADEELEAYYTSYSDCIADLFSLDIAGGAAIDTVEGFVAYWQNFLGDQISSIGDNFGIVLTFSDVSATVESGENDMEFTFSSSASLTQSKNYFGVEISAYTVSYSLSVKVENDFIAEINAAINQELTLTADGETVTMKGAATSKDTFTMAYDSSVIPSDFSDYITDEDLEDII